MDKEQQIKMVEFIINKNLELGKTLQDIRNVSLQEVAKGSTDSEAVEFHTAVKNECDKRINDKWDNTIEKKYLKEYHLAEDYIPSLSDEDVMKMLQDEYDRSAYLDPTTDNIDLY